LKETPEKPLGKLYGFGRHHLTEERYGLNIEALGKGSEIIVLKDSRIRFTAPKHIEEVKGPESMDILAIVDAETGLPTLADIEKNIEELKPRESKYLGWEEFQSLQTKIANGFTMFQLKTYIKSLEARHKDDYKQAEELALSDASPILRISAWMPGISDSVTWFDESPLRGYRSEAFTPKQRTVLEILRQHWQIGVLEVNEDIGEIEIELRAMYLELLISMLGLR
jgi:hypothetical protein